MPPRRKNVPSSEEAAATIEPSFSTPAKRGRSSTRGDAAESGAKSASSKRSRSKSSELTPRKSASPPLKAPSSTPVKQDSSHHEVEYEFGGPLGALGVIVGLPVVIYALYFVCNADSCVSNPFTFDWKLAYDKIPCCHMELFSKEATFMYLGWMAFHVILERVLPGEEALGVVLPNNKKLSYTLSGHLQFWITLIFVTHGFIQFSSGKIVFF